MNFYPYADNNPVTEVDPSGCGFIDCRNALAELADAIKDLAQREAENKCPDKGHDKAIEQAKNRVRNALGKATHCLDPQTISKIELALAVGTVAALAPELLPWLAALP
jgi:hypothetical protein